MVVDEFYEIMCVVVVVFDFVVVVIEDLVFEICVVDGWFFD